MCRKAIGRISTTPVVAAIVKASSWNGNGRNMAKAAVNNAAPPSTPSAAVKVKISATPSTTAKISQMTHSSMQRPPVLSMGPLEP